MLEKVLNDTKLAMSDPFNHPEPSEDTYLLNQYFDREFFAISYRRAILIKLTEQIQFKSQFC